MTEQTETEEPKPKKKLSLSRPGRLELNKTVEAGQVRQSFSHGRSKAVAVEVRRKRTFKQSADGGMTEVKLVPGEPEVAAETVAPVVSDEAAAAAEAEEARRAAALRALTEEEKAARARALSGAKHAETEYERIAEEEARLRQEHEAEEQRLAEEARQREEEEVKRRADEEDRKRADDEAARNAAEQAARLEARGAKAGETEPDAADRSKAKLGIVDGAGARVNEPEDSAARGKRGRPEPRKLTPKRGESRRRSGRLTIAQALDDNERVRSLASLKRSRERERRALQGLGDGDGKIIRDVVVPETITVQELANRMAERAVDVVKALMKMDVMVTASQTIDADTAELAVTEFGHKLTRVSEADVEIGFLGEADPEDTMESRPPVVTVMGHVDHGKTSLLDALRSTDVVSGEAGGITQHIGAYQVRLGSGDRITFIDTPGHAAFTAMRARGANVTDIVILVVAADDGIMPQTVEAIDHAKAAEVPIIVAINKMDRPDADSTRVRNELLQHELVVEELGGDILAVEVSATEKTNLDRLEEAILLQAEILELKANPDRTAEGVVVEAKLERGRGAVTTVLVQRGTLNVGDLVVAGSEYGRVRAMYSDTGAKIESGGPSTPVEIIGLGGAPAAGDEIAVVDSESRARELTEFRERRAREERTAIASRGTLETMFDQIGSGESKELAILIKADAQGSIEAIHNSAQQISTDEVSVRVLHTGVGAINESDITLAKASNAMIIGFNVRANPQARELSARDRVDIRYYSIIYEVIDDLKTMLSSMLAPLQREHFLGNAKILEVFNITKIGRVAGCQISEGMVKRGAAVRLLRDNVVIHEGSLSTLKRFKDEVREVREGFECGMAFENYQDLKVDDVIECFEVEEVARTL
jgi:translation initiation factor IF-2